MASPLPKGRQGQGAVRSELLARYSSANSPADSCMRSSCREPRLDLGVCRGIISTRGDYKRQRAEPWNAPMLKGLSRAKNPAKETVAEQQKPQSREKPGARCPGKQESTQAESPEGSKRDPSVKQNKQLAPSPQGRLGVGAPGLPLQDKHSPLRCAPRAPSLRLQVRPHVWGRSLRLSACLVGFQAKPTSGAEDTGF